MDENLSDEELFMSNGAEEVTETPTEEVETVAETKPEDKAVEEVTETAKVEEVTPTDEVKPVEEEPEKVEAKDEGQVPSWRVREINEAKREAEAKLAQREQEYAQTQAQLNALQQQFNQQQQPQTPPDVFEDPQGFSSYQQQQFAQQARTFQMKTAELEAKVNYGAQEVDSAIKAALAVEHTNPQVSARIQSAQNPWAEAVQWHKEQQTQDAIGEGGIDGFRQREREALMADPEFRKSVFEQMRGEAGATPKPNIGSIPSLNGAPAASVNTDGPGSQSDEELFLNS